MILDAIHTERTSAMRSRIVVAVIGLLVLALGFLGGRVSAGGAQSDQVAIVRDVTGTVVKISADGDAVSIREQGGRILNTELLNALEVPLREGDPISGTLVEVHVPGTDGSQQELIVRASAPPATS